MEIAKFVPKVLSFFGKDNEAKIAEKVVNIAEQVTGKKIAKPADVTKAFEENPQLTEAFRQKLLDHEMELEKLALGDVKDARARDLELKKMGYSNIRGDLIVCCIFACIMANTYIIVTMTLPDAVMDMLDDLQTALVAWALIVMNFEFGSSRGSKEKDLIRK